VKRQKLQLD